MKKLFFIAAICFTSVSFAQCLKPTGLTLDSLSYDNAIFSWDGPIDSFYVEYGVIGNSQGTGASFNIVDTVFDFAQHSIPIGMPLLNPCSDYKFLLYRYCNGLLSDSVRMEFFTKPKNGYPLLQSFYYTSTVGLFSCSDSIYTSTGKGFEKGTKLTNPPQHGASGIGDPHTVYLNSSSLIPYLYADGSGVPDSSMKYFYPWIRLNSNNVKAFFYFFSNNTNYPGDNVTMNVHVETNIALHKNVYSYSGDDNRWKMGYIDLGPYYSAGVTKFRLIIEIDQTTAIQPEYNDFLFMSLGFRTGNDYCPVHQYDSPIVDSIAPGTVQVSRVNSKQRTQLQWGPVGFTPFNGQFGDTTIFDTNHVVLSGLPMTTKWLYYKDTCATNLPFPQWAGPIQFDSIGSAMVEARVYIDRDSNCSLGQNDVIPWLSNTNVNIKELSSSNTSDLIIRGGNRGRLANRVPINKSYMAYLFTVNKNFAMQPCSNDTFYFSTTDTLIHSLQFAIEPLQTNEIANNIREQFRIALQGSKQHFAFEFKNYSKFDIDTVKMRLTVTPNDTTMVVDSISYPGSTVISSNPLTFYKEYYSVQTLLRDTVSFHAKIGNQYFAKSVQFLFEVDSLVNEQTTANNTLELTVYNVAAIDPNDKLVSPPRNQTDTNINNLNYRIRFQNTGNHPATTVRILDTLPAYFAHCNVTFLEASHPMAFSVDTNALVLDILFDNIQLPDSARDPEGSNGYVDFNIGLKSAMQVGDSVANRAFIYFDYQPPIITHWAWTKIVQPDQTGLFEFKTLSFNLFPNPAQNSVRIETVESGHYHVLITDLTGKVLSELPFSGNRFEVNTEKLNTGIYLIQLKNDDQKAFGTEKLTIIK